MTDRIRDPASDSTLDSSTLESEPDSDYLEETGCDEKAENKCTKCGTLLNSELSDSIIEFYHIFFFSQMIYRSY